MDSQKPQIEELQNLSESLELQRRPALALILELQDGGAGPEKTEKARLKLELINQEMAQCKNQIKSIRRQQMGFETPTTMKIISKALQKADNAALKEAVRVRDEAEVDVQVLRARVSEFEGRIMALTADIAAGKEEISRILSGGGDPSDLNRQVRGKGLEIEDLESWIGQLNNQAIPAAEKLLSEAHITVWKCLLKVAGEVKTTFSEQMNSHLAQAAEFAHSWQAAMKEFFQECHDGRQPAVHTLHLTIDPKRSFFAALGLS